MEWMNKVITGQTSAKRENNQYLKQKTINLNWIIDLTLHHLLYSVAASVIHQLFNEQAYDSLLAHLGAIYDANDLM